MNSSKMILKFLEVLNFNQLFIKLNQFVRNYTRYHLALQLCIPIFVHIQCRYFYQVKVLVFCNVQITNLTFVGKTMRCMVNVYSFVYFQIVSDIGNSSNLIDPQIQGPRIHTIYVIQCHLLFGIMQYNIFVLYISHVTNNYYLDNIEP